MYLSYYKGDISMYTWAVEHTVVNQNCTLCPYAHAGIGGYLRNIY